MPIRREAYVMICHHKDINAATLLSDGKIAYRASAARRLAGDEMCHRLMRMPAAHFAIIGKKIGIEYYAHHNRRQMIDETIADGEIREQLISARRYLRRLT